MGIETFTAPVWIEPRFWQLACVAQGAARPSNSKEQ